MVKRLIAIVILAFGALELGAQNFPSDQWYVGEIRLSNNTYLKGKIKYDLEHDVVQLEQSGTVKTFSPKQVTSFRLKLAPRKLRGKIAQAQVTDRYFFSLPFTNNAGYKRPRFFEVVVEGKATLLAREYVTTVTNNAGNRQRLGRARDPRFGGLNARQPVAQTRRVLAHKMFLASLDGSIKELPNKRKDLLFMFRDHQSDMKTFMKEERLRMDQLYDVARFFIHYNTLGNQQSKAH